MTGRDEADGEDTRDGRYDDPDGWEIGLDRYEAWLGRCGDPS